MERIVAHHRGAGPAGRSTCDGRLQSVRLRLRAASRGEAGVSGFLRRLFGLRTRRGFTAAAPFRTGARVAADGEDCRADAPQAKAGDLQLLGGDRVQSE